MEKVIKFKGDPDRLVTIDAVAAKLSCSRTQVRRLKGYGLRPVSLIDGSMVRYRVRDVEDWAKTKMFKGVVRNRSLKNAGTQKKSDRIPA